jgi:hypothetical protein
MMPGPKERGEASSITTTQQKKEEDLNLQKDR